ENLAARAADVGAYFMEGLKRLQSEFPEILVDVRGKGLMLGMEFPNDAVGYDVAKALYARGVLVAGTLINAEVVRIEPPLTIPREDVTAVLERLEDALKAVRAR